MSFAYVNQNLTLQRQLHLKSDDALLDGLFNLRTHEKATVADILLYLREVDQRSLHLSRGYSSLYEFCLEELGYNKDEAYYRISAMKLLSDVPEVESQLREGSLSLTVAAKAQIAFRRENQRRREERETPLALDRKQKILLDLSQCTKKESEKTLAQYFPQVIPSEKTQVLSENRTLLQFSVSDELMAKLEKLKGLLAHKNPTCQWESLISNLADMALEKLDPDLKRQKRNPCLPVSELRTNASQDTFDSAFESEPAVTAACESTRNEPAKAIEKSPSPQGNIKTPNGISTSFVPARKGRKYISVHLKRKLWQRANGQCEFINIGSGRRCSSKHALQLDHKWSLALGGEDTFENLRWYCRSHNAFAAQESLGVSKTVWMQNECKSNLGQTRKMKHFNVEGQ